MKNKWETVSIDLNDSEALNAFFDSVKDVEDRVNVPLKLSIDVIIEFKGFCTDSIKLANGQTIIFDAYNCNLKKHDYSVERKLSLGLFSRLTDRTTCHIDGKPITEFEKPLIGKYFIIKGFIQETETEFKHRENLGKVYRNGGYQSPIMYECDENGNIYTSDHETITRELTSKFNQISFKLPID